MSTPYRYVPDPRFSHRLEKIKKHDPPGYRRIVDVIDRLLHHPNDADGRMVGVHHGRMKKYVGRRDYRLIYHWCEDCRKEQRKLQEQCSQCRQVDDHSVIFFDIYHKNELAHLKHMA